MPRFYPDILFSDCWGSIGDKTFYHRKGRCYYRTKCSPAFPGTNGQLDQASLHHRALEAWRQQEPEVQRLWNKYALEVPSQRPPYDPKTSISGYNLFVSAYHGFAQLGNEHVPSPRRKGHFPVFALDFLSASVLDDAHLLLRFRSTFSLDGDGRRYRYLLKLQLERPGRGKNSGLLRNFLALPGSSANGEIIEFFVRDYRQIWGFDLPAFQAHCRYLLLDSETGFRCRFKEKSFQFSYGYL